MGGAMSGEKDPRLSAFGARVKAGIASLALINATACGQQPLVRANSPADYAGPPRLLVDPDGRGYVVGADLLRFDIKFRDTRECEDEYNTAKADPEFVMTISGYGACIEDEQVSMNLMKRLNRELKEREEDPKGSAAFPQTPKDISEQELRSRSLTLASRSLGIR